MHDRCWAIVFAMFLLTAVSAQAKEWSAANLPNNMREAQKNGTHTYAVKIDNDSLLLQYRDGFYSSGANITASHRLRSDNLLLINSWRIGQEIYTPSDIKLPPEQVRPPEHPYAA